MSEIRLCRANSRVLAAEALHAAPIGVVLPRIRGVRERDDRRRGLDLRVEELVPPGRRRELRRVVVQVDVAEAEAEVVESPFLQVQLLVLHYCADGRRLLPGGGAAHLVELAARRERWDGAEQRDQVADVGGRSESQEQDP